MYALPKGNTNKLFVKTRRGISQKFDSFDSQQKESLIRTDFDVLRVNNISTIKPVFHGINSKKQTNGQKTEEKVSPQHEEMIKYIGGSWKNVLKDYESCCKTSEDCNGVSSKSIASASTSNANVRVAKISYYKVEGDKSAQLPKFEPFDLEAFWGQRLFQNLTQSS